jgi:ribosomal protein S20
MVNKLRPSPSDSATMYNEGYELVGNNGDIWKVVCYNNGTGKSIKKWHNTKIKQSKSTIYHKFKVGDIVKVVESGYGASKDDMYQLVTIVECGIYNDNYPGYKVHPAIGNTKAGFYNGIIREESFTLITASAEITLNKIKTMAKSTKSITKKTAQEVRTIETSLINKEEVFKMLALAESTGLPCLLVGDPGVAKTKTIIEYAKAWLNKDGKMTAEDFINKIYILETDEGTKASEIKGMPDLSVLFTENKYKVNAPIADAEIVIINEVDKASSAIRNAMLGVMNEKFLFNGKDKIPCKWKLFIATCNEIPKDEANSPFWDRFMLKMKVSRVSAGELVKYYNKGGRNYREVFNISIPSTSEIESINIHTKKLEKYLEVGYQSSSDRTLTFVPKLAKAVSFIWDFSIDKALVKTAQIMIDQKAGSELQNKLMSSEVKSVMSKVEMLQSYTTNDELELAIADIESLINTYVSRNIMDETQVEELELSMQYILQNHPARVVTDINVDENSMMAQSDDSVLVERPVSVM